MRAAPFIKKKMAKEVEILDNEMQSRHDKIHGNEGLCCASVDAYTEHMLKMAAAYDNVIVTTSARLIQRNDRD